MPKRRLTPNRAAAAVRNEILRKMKSLESTMAVNGYPYEALWEELRVWIKMMARRASAKKGGLGRH